MKTPHQMTEYEDRSFAVGSGYGRGIGRTQGGYDEGIVITPHGIVTVYAQGGDNWPPMSVISMCARGREWQRCWERRLRPRYLVTLAKRFANEISEGGEGG